MKDINRDMQFKTNRVVNPLDPRYFLQSDESHKPHEYGAIAKSIPKRLHPVSVHKSQDFPLHTDDIEGAVASTKGNKAIISKTRRDFRIINKVEDVGGAQVGTLKKGIVTKRCTNPNVPVYIYPGHTEPTIFDRRVSSGAFIVYQSPSGNPSMLNGKQPTLNEERVPKEVEPSGENSSIKSGNSKPKDFETLPETSKTKTQMNSETEKQETLKSQFLDLAPLKQRKWETGNQIASNGMGTLDSYVSARLEPLSGSKLVQKQNSRSNSSSRIFKNEQLGVTRNSMNKSNYGQGEKKVSLGKNQGVRIKENEFEIAKKTFFGIDETIPNNERTPSYVPGTMKRDHLSDDPFKSTQRLEELNNVDFILK